MREMISLEEAQNLTLKLVEPLETAQVSLYTALNRVLAEDIYSEVNVPPFDRSPLDGYAVRAADTSEAKTIAPVFFEVIEEVPAGYVACKQLTNMSAIKIMTGAPIPLGADTVIRFEDITVDGNRVGIHSPLKHRDNISQAGEDIAIGSLLLAKHTTLNATAIGLLASVGKSLIPVVRKPRVAILSTGDELVDVEGPLPPGKIRNSNLYLLTAAIQAAGGEPVVLGIVPDRKEDTIKYLQQSLVAADLVITTGGVSVGDYDVVKEAMVAAGAEVLFWKIALKPGTPVVVSKAEGKLIIGLSGNPAGASIVFDVLVKPIIRKLSGKLHHLPIKTVATLDNHFAKRSGMRRLLRGRVYRQGEELRVALTGKQNPGVLRSLLECNALIDVPAGSEPLVSEKQVDIFFIGDNENRK